MYTEIIMSSPNPRDIRQLADEILIAEENLASLRRRWDAVFGNVEPVLELVPEKNRGGRPTSEDGLSGRVLTHINTHDGDWNMESVSRALHADKRRVATALYNLYKAKRIARGTRGNYHAWPASEEVAA